MVRRAALLSLLLSACSTRQPGEPSLAPRAAEAIDPRVPIPSEVRAGPADPALVARIADLMAEVRSGDAAFQAAAQNAEPRPRRRPGAKRKLDRGPAGDVRTGRRPRPGDKAIADLDGLASTRLAASGGILPGDLAAIQAATAEAGEIGEREAALINRLRRDARRYKRVAGALSRAAGQSPASILQTIDGLSSGPKRSSIKSRLAPPMHPEPLHQALARAVGGDGHGDDCGRREAAEGEVERRDGRFLGDALPPGAFAQPPADLEAGRSDRPRPAH